MDILKCLGIPFALIFIVITVPINFVLIYPILLLGVFVGFLLEGLRFLLVIPALGVYRLVKSKSIVGFETRLLFIVCHLVITPIIPVVYVCLLPVGLIFVGGYLAFVGSIARLKSICGSDDEILCDCVRDTWSAIRDVTNEHIDFLLKVYKYVDYAYGDVGFNIFAQSLQAGEAPLRISLFSLFAASIFFLLYYTITTPVMLLTQLLRMPLAMYARVIATFELPSYGSCILPRFFFGCLAIPIWTLLYFLAFLVFTVGFNIELAARAAAVYSAHGTLPYLRFTRDLIDIHAVSHAVAFRYFEFNDWPLICCFVCRRCCPGYFRRLRQRVVDQWKSIGDLKTPLGSPHTEYVYMLASGNSTDSSSLSDVLTKLYHYLDWYYPDTHSEIFDEGRGEVFEAEGEENWPEEFHFEDHRDRTRATSITRVGRRRSRSYGSFILEV
jgi:hypothetical protein